MSDQELKVTVGLYVRGDGLNPDSVSNVLGIEPSWSQEKGERKVTSTGREVIAKTGVWALVVAADSSELADHIGVLISKIGMKGQHISSILGVDDAYVDVFVAALSDTYGEASCAFELNVKVLAALKDMGLPLRLTVTSGPE